MLVIPNIFIHLAALLLALNAGANDIIVATTTLTGSRSLHRRIILFLITLTLLFSFFLLKNATAVDEDDSGPSSWIRILSENSGLTAGDKDEQRIRDVLGMAIMVSSIFTLISVLSKLPLPLDASLCAFLYGYLLNSHYPFFTLIRTILLPYLILPIISGSVTWCIYRILIKGIMFSAEEDKFNRTLSWCGLVYPLAMATSLTALSLKYFLSALGYAPRHLISHGLFIVSFALFYAFFKVFLRAWLKRRAFLLYPQEHALYMERSEKVEQGDREARGLGPIRDYYLPKASAASSSVTKPSQSIMADNNSTVQVPISPAVIAGKRAIAAKRSEELFKPALNLVGIVTLFISMAFESGNVFSILKRAVASYNPQFLLWTVLLTIIPGSLLLSQQFAVFFGRNIINDMRFSQAFAIQMGVLFTITLAHLLQRVPQAPAWYLLFSIAAVSSSQPQNQINLPDDFADIEEGNNTPNFRYKLRLVGVFWACSIVFSGIMGAFFCHTQKQH